MHNKSAIIIMMAAVMLSIISGCGKKDSAWINPPIVTIPDQSQTRSAETINPKSKLIKARDALSIPGASRKQYGISGTVRNESSADLTGRFMKNFNEWHDYRSQLPDKLMLVKSNNKTAEIRGNEIVKPVTPEMTYVPEYQKSTDILNWKIRIMLLENRLKTVGDADKSQIADKLKQAKASLAESEQTYGKLIPVAPVVSIIPVIDENINHITPEKEITVVDMNSSNIVDTLAGLNKPGKQQEKIKASDGQVIITDYRSKLNETITEINKVLVELGTRH